MSKAAKGSPLRPSREELEAARSKRVPDLIGPGLRVLFSGINPSLYSGAVGHHFARPGNRFWPTLHRSGFTPRLVQPADERQLLELGIGITNLVPRTTARADELTPEELRTGATALIRKVKRHRPRTLAILGVTAYQRAFDLRDARIGPQPEGIGDTEVWVLPNPSGLNAHYQLDDLAREFRALRTRAGSSR